MDISKLLAAAPLLRKVWRVTPAPLRVPLAAVGVALVAWRWLSGRDRQHPSVAEHEADVAADSAG